MRSNIFRNVITISMLVMLFVTQMPAQIAEPQIGKLPGRFQPFDPSNEQKGFPLPQDVDRLSTDRNGPFKPHDGTGDLKHPALNLAVPDLRTIPFWSDYFDYHGLRYPYKMVGTDPKRGSATTVIPTVLIPIRWVFADGSVLDASTDLIDGQTPIQGIINSPLFQDYDFVSGGTHVGNTQFGDAFQRANFWNWVSTRSSNYHVRLGQPTVTPTQTINVPADKVQYFTNPDNGEVFPEIDRDFVDSLDQGLIAGQNVTPATLPIVVWGKVSAGNALGYHGVYQTGNSIQTYIDTSYLPSTTPFGFPGYIADVSLLSHEVIEWMDDPFVDNHSAGWNNPFYVGDPPPPRARCDSYFEARDLLETADPFENLGGLQNTLVVTNGYAYHIAEGAFIDFYTRSDRSRSVNGQYSFFEIARPYGLDTLPSFPCVSGIHPDMTFFTVPGATFTWPYGLNNTGAVVGYYVDTTGVAHGFVRNGFGYFTVDYPGAAATLLTDINDGGTLIGYYLLGTDFIPHGFSLRNGRFARLDFPGSTDTIPEKINSTGDIVGEYDVTQPVTHGFLIHNGQYSVIDTPYGLQSEAAGINDLGIIAGNSWTEVPGPASGFIQGRRGFSKFDFPDASFTNLTSINVNGDLSGYSTDPFRGFTEGVVTLYGYPYYLEGQFTYVPFVGDINNQRQIVGYGYDVNAGQFGAFIGQPPLANNGN